ncbi:MAG: LuxR C-terminal-related transcriptional regulator, partial [Anaerolineales bacterium]
MTVPPEEELSARELEVLARVVTGATNRQVAVELNISPNTVKVHVSSILAKLGAQSRAEATRIALERALVSASAEAGAPSDVPLAAAAPARPQLAWPLSPLAAYGILALVLVLLLTALLVPATQAGRHPVSGRLVDAPEVATIAGEAVASRWSLQVAMPTARARFGQAVVDDTIYVIGGQTTSGPTSAVEVYYPGLDLWGRGADKPTAVANVGAVAV